MKRTLLLASLATALTLAACGGGGGGSGSVTGGSAVFLKDAPLENINGHTADEINVEILKVELKGDDRKITVFEAPAGSGIAVNILALNFPTLLAMVNVPTGSYDKVEIKVSPDANIHFSDNNTTLPLVVTESGEGDELAEFEFEFEPPFSVEAGGVSNAVIDFAPIVTFDGSNYVLNHDHENDDTGEVEDVDGEDGPDHHGAEVEGTFVAISGDLVTVLVHGSQAQIDISTATSFQANDIQIDKAAFIASLSTGDEVEGEGVFTNGVLVASKIKNQGPDE